MFPDGTTFVGRAHRSARAVLVAGRDAFYRVPNVILFSREDGDEVEPVPPDGGRGAARPTTARRHPGLLNSGTSAGRNLDEKSRKWTEIAVFGATADVPDRVQKSLENVLTGTYALGIFGAHTATTDNTK